MTGPVPVAVPDLDAPGAVRRRPALVDGTFVLVLCGLGLVGFRALYGGWRYLAIGLIGAALGIGATELVVRWRKPVLVEAVSVVVLFLVVGGAVAARGTTVGGVVPTGATLDTLVHVGVYGWKYLLTTQPPVGNSAGLLAIPYLVGLAGGATGMSIARRTRAVCLPALGPLAVLALSILFGSLEPTSLLWQGTVFGGVALAWMAVRSDRYRPVVVGRTGGTRRRLTAVGVLVGAVLVAGLIGPRLPGAHSHQRVVLSRYVVPPFDVEDQPSPLAGFRQYVHGGASNRSLLFTVHGSGGYQPRYVRIATMDAYNGLVWGFGAAADRQTAVADNDAFQKFGSQIPAGVSGAPRTVDVTVGSLSGVWMPDAGSVTHISFQGAAAGQLDEDVRYDTATSTAAQPDGLASGESYQLQLVAPDPPTSQELAAAPPGDVQLSIRDVPSVVRSDAQQWAGSATSAWGKVEAIAAYLKEHGTYSDGSVSAGGAVLSLPGHGAGRLTTFLQGGGAVGNQIVGDDEQYAAAMALMADAVDVPARVVLGAAVPADGRVTGADVHAWVEVDLDGPGWVPLYWTSFMSTTPPNPTPPTPKPNNPTTEHIQPPAISAIHSPLDSQLPGSSAPTTAPAPNPGGPLIPAWVWTVATWVLPPALLIALVAGTILGLKRRRRNRRLLADRPSARIAGAWAELIDFERDSGRAIPVEGTRREQAPACDLAEAPSLAVQADAAVFGPGEPGIEEVGAFWAAVDRSMNAARAGLGRRDRWKVALSLRSLRVPGRDQATV